MFLQLTAQHIFYLTIWHSIKNSYDFIDKIKDIKIPEDHILISLDVTSLYTNVGERLFIESIEKRYSAISSKFKIPLNELVKLIMKKTYSSFK